MRVQTFIFVLLMVLAAPLFAAFPGNCLEFDGVDDNLDGDNFPTNLSQISMEAWIYHESLTSAIQRYITIGSEVAVIRSNGDDILHFYIKQSDGTLFGVEEHVLIADEWIHVAGTYDGSTLKLYINGIEVGSQVAPVGGIYAPNGDIGISSSDETMYGKMDEIRIWNDARTPAEIRENRFIELNGSESGLVSYWKLDESSGATAYDSAGNVDCTLNNMTNDDWVASGVPLVTVFSGIISSNTIWDEHMLITGDVTINDGATLTIHPGVQVYFDGNYKMDVQGRILAEGTASDSIKFTAHPTVPWNRIVFNYTPASNDSSKFVYCTIENADVSSNVSDYQGGAFQVSGFSKLRLEHCHIRNNKAEHGGAIYINSASIIVSNCIIENNEAVYDGGGIFIGNDSAPRIANSIIENNIAGDGGGGIRFFDVSSPHDSIPNVLNCLIIGNEAVYGGALSITNYAPNFTNCTILDNSASSNGGAIIEINSPNSVFRNCIMWGNEAAGLGDQVYLVNTAADPNFYNCNIEGGSDSFGGSSFNGTYQDCLFLDPLFEDPDNDDYSLSLLSPCINGGDPTTTTIQAGNYDLAGNNRFYDNELTQGSIDEALDRIDIGAYERQFSEVGILPHNFTISGYNYSAIDLHICAGFTVHMDPGTELRFNPNRGFNIEGNLQAIGEHDNMITIRPHSFSTGFKGLNFYKNQSDPLQYSSTLEYCRIQGGFAPGYPDHEGGNIYSYAYDEINLINCIIEKGNADGYGGGIFAQQTDVNIVNCILNENHAGWEGGAAWFQVSEVNIINSTIADNTSNSAGGAVTFELGDAAQPQIVNSIFWNNGDEPILPNDGSLTDVTYCNIETGFSGTGNISVEPNFTGETDHPYNIHKSSFCINAGKQDTTGLNLPQYDLLGNVRIYAHANSAYDRPDMGAYESQGTLAPGNFTASDGNNNYPGYVQLFWNYNDDYEPAPTNFRIYRDSININTLDGQADSFSDYTAVPGQIYSYFVQAVAGSETRNSDENSGYIKPNGIITGTVLSANNNPVQDVKVSISPSPGYCLEFDSFNSSSLTITNPEVNMDYNFTIEFWVKTSMNNVVLLQKGLIILKSHLIIWSNIQMEQIL